jgi:ATP-dependent exoDNAse (exonuclease V) beta subunit
VVAVTFTRKAAGELKLRLRHLLDSERQATEDETARGHLEEAMARLEEARIGTIHSFCAELLRERPVEAGIDPAFGELDQEASRAIHARAFDRWVQSRLGEMPPTLRRALARLGLDGGFSDDPPLKKLRNAAFGLLDWRDFPAPWRREEFPRSELLDRLIEEGRSLAERIAMGPSGDYLRRGMSALEEEIAWLDRAESGGPRDDDLVEARWIDLLRRLKREANRKGRGKKFGPLDREEVLRRRDDLMSLLEDFRLRAEADLAVALREELGGAVAGYEELKRREGQLDFLDLLLRTRDLLRDDQTVRAHFQQRFSHLFVDEFQDTDPLQAEILLLLSGADSSQADWHRVAPAPGKLFLVGDPKQSIYRFRRADIILYRDIKERLAAAGISTLILSKSYRSVEGIQRVVNHAFREQMTGDRATAQPDYIPLLPHRADPEVRPSVVALPAPRPYGWRGVANYAIEKCLPDTVAAYVDWLVNDSGWTVEDPEAPGSGVQVPILPRHVALLFRRFVQWGTDVSRLYGRALEERQVPHVLLGARSFHQREEVETLRAALHAVEWPDDELSVYAALRGALFGVSDEFLLRFRHEVGRLHPFRRVPEEASKDLEPVVEGLRELARLNRDRNRIPIVETLQRLLDGGRAHVAFALRPAGNRVLANVLHVLELARGFEMRGGLSFRRFVEQLDEQADSLQARQAPVVEEGTEGVRLMTVHNAKGLEFPVVILVDPTAKLARATADTHVDASRELWAGRVLGCSPWELLDAEEEEVALDLAEGVRVSYVAATRARDLLVAPVVGDERRSGWTGPLNGALYPDAERWRAVEPAPGCPAFGSDSVLERPAGFEMTQTHAVRPGRHTIGDASVVWWDPGVLELEVPRTYGLRAEDLLVAQSDAKVRVEGLEKWSAWRSEVTQAVSAGSVARLTVETVTSTTLSPSVEVPMRVESLEREPGRPSGRRFGSLVHGILETVELDAERPRIEQLAEARARGLEAPDEEVRAAIEIVVRALQHPVMRQAAGASRCLREAAFVLRLPPTGAGVEENPVSILEGAIDLAYRVAPTQDEDNAPTPGDDAVESSTDGMAEASTERTEAWVVVDFKTDRDGGDKASYRRQVSWYAQALRELGARGEITAVLFEL